MAFHCKALVLLEFYCVLPFLYSKRSVIYCMSVLACSCCVVVSSALLYIATVCLIFPCWKNVSGGPELGWVIVLLVAGRVIGRGWVVGLILWLLEF